MRNKQSIITIDTLPDGMSRPAHPLAGEKRQKLISFSQNYPITARQFDTSAAGFAAWCDACADHGWSPSEDIFSLADSLMMLVVSWYQDFSIFHSPKFNYRLIRIQQEYAKMARRPNKNMPPARAKFQGFLDYRLTEDQLIELDQWEPTPAEIWEQVDMLLTEKYRVALSYNANTKTATATIMDDDPARKAGGWSLASSDANGAAALKAALYKHFHVLAADWEVLLDLPNAGGRRG